MTGTDLKVWPVLVIRSVLDGWTLEAEEALWKDLIVWCEGRQLFAGGDAEAAIIYSPDGKRLHRCMRELRKWMLSRVDGHAFLLELVEVRRLDTPRLKRAATEAIIDSQRAAARQLERANDALAAVALASSVRPRTMVSSDGTSLEVTLAQQELQITLSRLDGQPEPLFEAFRGSMRVGELLHLLPSVAFQAWEIVPPVGDLSAGEWVSESGAWRINVQALTGDFEAGHAAVMRRLVRLLTDE